MRSAHYQSMSQSIDKMADWKAAALCADCASKITPIIARLGLPDTWRLVEECLDQPQWGRLSADLFFSLCVARP